MSGTDFEQHNYVCTHNAPEDAFTTKPLAAPKHMDSTTIKRCLNSAFGDSINSARKLTTDLMSEKQSKLHVLSQILTLLGRACGYCFAKGVSNPGEHFGFNCPSMCKSTQKTFKYFRTSIIYPEKYQTTRPCFYCHVCSMGDDRLHPPFVTKGVNQCPNPNSVAPIAFAVYYISTLRTLAEGHFEPKKYKHSWESIDKFKDWFIAEDDRYSTKGMALLAWYATYRLKL
jgi:hypothetical protein